MVLELVLTLVDSQLNSLECCRRHVRVSVTQLVLVLTEAGIGPTHGVRVEVGFPGHVQSQDVIAEGTGTR